LATDFGTRLRLFSAVSGANSCRRARALASRRAASGYPLRTPAMDDARPANPRPTMDIPSHSGRDGATTREEDEPYGDE
jgi:hypothetical protein